ncbi:MAG: transposase [Verrucomicrobiae bacterium]|nr:transposase [Verrucomicrobiae bacterium]
MNSKPRRRYTAEFKAEAVERLQAGRPVPELAEELGHVQVEQCHVLAVRPRLPSCGGQEQRKRRV